MASRLRMLVNIAVSLIGATGPWRRPQVDGDDLSLPARRDRPVALNLVVRRAQPGMPEPSHRRPGRNAGKGRPARSVGPRGKAGVDDVDIGDHPVMDVAAQGHDPRPIEADAARLLAGKEPELEAADRREGIDVVADIVEIGEG